MQRILFFLLAFSGLVPDLASQNLKPISTTGQPGCRVIKPAEFLDQYFVCGADSRHADILQVSFGETGPKLHVFTSRTAWAEHFGKVDHTNCADYLVTAGSKADRRIQRTFRKYLK